MNFWSCSLYFIFFHTTRLLSKAQEKATEPSLDLESRIHGGKDADDAEFPFQVSIQKYEFNGPKLIHYCGGVILNQETILTAAHCMEQYPHIPSYVVAGTNNIINPDGSEQRSNISALTRHPLHSRTTLKNDIALLKLTTPLRYSARVAPVKLPTPGREPHGLCVAVGWGLLGTKAAGFPKTLQKVEIDVIERLKCPDLLDFSRPADDTRIFDEGMICTHGAKGIGTRFGDSGSAFMCKDDDGKYYLAGIHSYSAHRCGVDGCNDEPLSGVAAHIGYYYCYLFNNFLKPDIPASPRKTDVTGDVNKECVKKVKGTRIFNNKFSGIVLLPQIEHPLNTTGDLEPRQNNDDCKDYGDPCDISHVGECCLDNGGACREVESRGVICSDTTAPDNRADPAHFNFDWLPFFIEHFISYIGWVAAGFSHTRDKTFDKVGSENEVSIIELQGLKPLLDSPDLCCLGIQWTLELNAQTCLRVEIGIVMLDDGNRRIYYVFETTKGFGYVVRLKRFSTNEEGWRLTAYWRRKLIAYDR